MNGLVWIASYPKSGNTWMRIFLTNYLQDGEEPVSINAVRAIPSASARLLIEQAIGIESTDLNLDEAEAMRPKAYRWLAAHPDESPPYLKVHDQYHSLAAGTPLFPPEATKSALYILRNPLDVALSGAPFFQMNLADTVAMMANPQMALNASRKKVSAQLREYVGHWSDHVTSWLDAPEPFPRLPVRYEAMKEAPWETFGNVVRFLGLPWDEHRLEKAIRFSSFDTLKAQESAGGFREKPLAAERFFRSGRTDEWRERLPDELVKQLIHDHGDVMRRFGYLDTVTL